MVANMRQCKYKALSDHDVARMIAHVPGEIVEMMQEHRIIIAGGFCRSIVSRETPRDIDVFVTDASKQSPEQLVESLLKRNSHLRVEASERAATIIGLKVPVQFVVHAVFAGATRVLDSFDFTINQAAIFNIDGSWTGICGESFYEHLASRTLVPASVDQHGGNLILRMLKFVARGFTIPRPQLVEVLNALYSQAEFEQKQNALEAAMSGNVTKGLEQTLRTNYQMIGKKRFDLEQFKEHVKAKMVQEAVGSATGARHQVTTRNPDSWS